MDLRDLTKPWRLQRGFDRLIEQERDLSRGKDLEGEESRLYERLEEMTTSGHVRRILPSDDLLTREELRVKPLELDEAKEATEKELEACAHRAERIRALQQDRDAKLAAFAESVPEKLDRLAPEECRRIKMLRLRVEVGGDRRTEIGGSLTGSEAVCRSGGTGCNLSGRYKYSAEAILRPLAVFGILFWHHAQSEELISKALSAVWDHTERP